MVQGGSGRPWTAEVAASVRGHLFGGLYARGRPRGRPGTSLRSVNKWPYHPASAQPRPSRPITPCEPPNLRWFRRWFRRWFLRTRGGSWGPLGGSWGRVGGKAEVVQGGSRWFKVVRVAHDRLRSPLSVTVATAVCVTVTRDRYALVCYVAARVAAYLLSHRRWSLRCTGRFSRV